MSHHAVFTPLRADHFRQIVFVHDGDGPKSITNDAEAITRILNEEFPNYRFLYKDTAGTWDELLHVRGVFSGFRLGPPERP